MLSSKSVEAEPSNEQVRSMQSEVNRASGGWLAAGALPGRSRIVHMVAALDVALAVPTTPPVLAGVPAVIPDTASVRSVPIRPLPVPVVLARLISGGGAVHRVVAAFLSVQ